MSMQQLVRVQKCNDDQTALVSRLCFNDCQRCAGCKKYQLQKVKNPINAVCGQVVLLTTNIWKKLFVKASYLLPVVLFLVGLGCWRYTGGVVGFLLGLFFAFWMTTKEVGAYTITVLSKGPEEKGDNDLD